MKTKTFFAAQLLISCMLLSGCAATGVSQDKLEQRTSMAIGRDVGSFTISGQQMESGGGGRLNYDAKTPDGTVYKCYVIEGSGLQKMMSFGMVPFTSDAICTKFGREPNTSSSKAAPKQPTANVGCNALLKAAGKC